MIDLELQGSVIVVTGAGSGIGAAAARLLGACRARVVLVGRRAELLRQTADAIGRDGGQVLCVAADLADADTPDRIAASTLETFGRIDGLVNNAAVCPRARWAAT